MIYLTVGFWERALACTLGPFLAFSGSIPSHGCCSVRQAKRGTLLGLSKLKGAWETKTVQLADRGSSKQRFFLYS